MSGPVITAAGSERALDDADVLAAYGWEQPGESGRPYFRFNFVASADGAVSWNGDFDPQSYFFAAAPVKPLVLTSAAAPAGRRAALEQVADVEVAGARTVEPGRAAGALARRGWLRVLCEGGPRLFGSFQAAGLVDELCLTLSPVLAAGSSPRISAGAPEIELKRLRLGHVLRSGDTLLLRYLAR
ncbi:dihydrofolate reductase family protein [Arthrobacter gandavensis]|uniref:dihydrofolate reductase family protein n=1 Tax=Arthrobacter gandavensis TaxID=169960 RepID=UPI002B26926B|nr:dihydrofolate reductase family protein [Arthrobacter gandavensis]